MVFLLHVISVMGCSCLGAYLAGMLSGLVVDAGFQLGVHLGMSTRVFMWPGLLMACKLGSERDRPDNKHFKWKLLAFSCLGLKVPV